MHWEGYTPEVETFKKNMLRARVNTRQIDLKSLYGTQSIYGPIPSLHWLKSVKTSNSDTDIRKIGIRVSQKDACAINK